MVNPKKHCDLIVPKKLPLVWPWLNPTFGLFPWFFLHSERINVTQNFAYESDKHKMSEPPTKELTLYILPPAKDARLWGSSPIVK